MRKIQYTAKSGKKFFRIEMDEATYRWHDEDYYGFCIACGEEAMQCEPDARHYKCESCNEDSVFGASELLIMGFILITETV